MRINPKFKSNLGCINKTSSPKQKQKTECMVLKLKSTKMTLVTLRHRMEPSGRIKKKTFQSDIKYTIPTLKQRRGGETRWIHGLFRWVNESLGRLSQGEHFRRIIMSSLKYGKQFGGAMKIMDLDICVVCLRCRWETVLDMFGKQLRSLRF